jgi:hypothetical protein
MHCICSAILIWPFVCALCVCVFAAVGPVFLLILLRRPLLMCWPDWIYGLCFGARVSKTKKKSSTSYSRQNRLEKKSYSRQNEGDHKYRQLNNKEELKKRTKSLLAPIKSFSFFIHPLSFNLRHSRVN